VDEMPRIYLLAGLQEVSAAFPPQKADDGSPDSTAQQRHNPNPVQWFVRAVMFTDMDKWVSTDGPAHQPRESPILKL